MHLAMEHARAYGMGMVMSLLLMVHSLGMMVGPVLLGFIADHYGLGGAFYSAGLVGVFATGACYVLTRMPTLEPGSVQEAEKELVVSGFSKR